MDDDRNVKRACGVLPLSPKRGRHQAGGTASIERGRDGKRDVSLAGANRVSEECASVAA